jgi:hypothetical protein
MDGTNIKIAPAPASAVQRAAEFEKNLNDAIRMSKFAAGQTTKTYSGAPGIAAIVLSDLLAEQHRITQRLEELQMAVNLEAGL